MFPGLRYIHKGFNPFSIVLTARLYNYRRKRKFWRLGKMFGQGTFFGGVFLLEVLGIFFRFLIPFDGIPVSLNPEYPPVSTISN